MESLDIVHLYTFFVNGDAAFRGRAQPGRSWRRRVQRPGLAGRLFAETTAQHFQTTTGGYEAPALSHSGYPCRPLARLNATRWQSHLARRTFEGRHPRLRVLRFFEITAPLWDLHSGAARDGKADCTHFCYAPGLLEAVLDEVATAVAALGTT